MCIYDIILKIQSSKEWVGFQSKRTSVSDGKLSLVKRSPRLVGIILYSQLNKFATSSIVYLT